EEAEGVRGHPAAMGPPQADGGARGDAHRVPEARPHLLPPGPTQPRGRLEVQGRGQGAGDQAQAQGCLRHQEQEQPKEIDEAGGRENPEAC
ncbi:hypothetical protein GN156_27460, partial [bacterium LRH843]|nr:hypothetical protein [bacterium LRH843]